MPVRVTSCRKKLVQTNEIYVGGFYNSEYDQDGLPPIEINLAYCPKQTHIDLIDRQLSRICILVADVTLHEIVHLKQYRCRNFSDIIGTCNCVCCGICCGGGLGNNNVICNSGAIVIGSGITSKVASHVHVPNMVFSAATGPHASDACFYAAGGTAGQTYMLCVGSNSWLTVAGYNP